MISAFSAMYAGQLRIENNFVAAKPQFNTFIFFICALYNFSTYSYCLFSSESSRRVYFKVISLVLILQDSSSCLFPMRDHSPLSTRQWVMYFILQLWWRGTEIPKQTLLFFPSSLITSLPGSSFFSCQVMDMARPTQLFTFFSL